MAIITFMSDFGNQDHYVAAVKGALINASEAQKLSIVDISHEIRPHDIGHAAYVLSHAYPHFPIGTIHLVGLEPRDQSDCRTIIASINGHYFVGADSGLFSLLGSEADYFHVMQPYNSFAALENYVPVATELSKGKKPEQLGSPITDALKLFARQPKVTKREIVGNIIRVDRFGNLITNILQTDFEKIMELNGQKPYEIQVGLQVFTKINRSYDEVESGECYLLFNHYGKLQIGINKGHGSQLLGLKLDAPIYITFEQN